MRVYECLVTSHTTISPIKASRDVLDPLCLGSSPREVVYSLIRTIEHGTETHDMQGRLTSENDLISELIENFGWSFKTRRQRRSDYRRRGCAETGRES